MNGMELRNGTWTSQTRARDAEDIKSLARQIVAKTDDPIVRQLAERVQRLARDLND